MIEHNCNPLLKLCNSTGDTSWPTNLHSINTGVIPLTPSFQQSHLIPHQAAGEVSWASAILQRSAIATRHCMICSHVPKQQEQRGKVFSELRAKEGAATALNESLFLNCGFLNASENQLIRQHSKSCLKSHRFFGKESI